MESESQPICVMCNKPIRVGAIGKDGGGRCCIPTEYTNAPAREVDLHNKCLNPYLEKCLEEREK